MRRFVVLLLPLFFLTACDWFTKDPAPTPGAELPPPPPPEPTISCLMTRVNTLDFDFDGLAEYTNDCSYSYDAQGRLTDHYCLVTSMPGPTYTDQFHSYSDHDAQGNAQLYIWEIDNGQDGIMDSTYRYGYLYDYDVNGWISRSVRSDLDQFLVALSDYIMEYTRNADGLATDAVVGTDANFDGLIDSPTYYTYSYDAWGNLETFVVDDLSTSVQTTTHQNTLDAQNRVSASIMTMDTWYYGGGPNSYNYFDRTFTYDDAGNLIEEFNIQYWDALMTSPAHHDRIVQTWGDCGANAQTAAVNRRKLEETTPYMQ